MGNEAEPEENDLKEIIKGWMRKTRSTSALSSESYFYGKGFNILHKGVTLLDTWNIYVTRVTETMATISIIWPPVLQSLVGIQKILRLTRESMRVAYTLYTRKEWNPEDEGKKTLLQKTLGYRVSSLLSKTIVVTLYTMTVLAFAGIISSPIGLALIAAAAAVEWLDDHIKPLLVMRNQKGIDKEWNSRREEAIIGFFNITALALIACQPLAAGTTLFAIGVVIFSIASLYNASKHLLFNEAIKNNPEEYHKERNRTLLGLVNVLTFGVIAHGPIHLTDIGGAITSIVSYVSLSAINLVAARLATATTATISGGSTHADLHHDLNIGQTIEVEHPHFPLVPAKPEVITQYNSMFRPSPTDHDTTPSSHDIHITPGH